MGLFGRFPGYGFPQIVRITGSGVILGATKNPPRWHMMTLPTPGFVTASDAISCPVSPAPRTTTVLGEPSARRNSFSAPSRFLNSDECNTRKLRGVNEVALFCEETQFTQEAPSASGLKSALSLLVHPKEFRR